MNTTSITNDDLSEYIIAQLNNFFPDRKYVSRSDILNRIPSAMDSLEYCFSHISDKYFGEGETTKFNHLNGNQYSMLLYKLSNIIYKETGETTLPTKIYLLNRALNNIDIYYEVQLPDIFLFNHTLGSVIGRAKYSDYFMISQNCNVGSNHDIYPTLGKFVSLHPNSIIQGNCHVGNNVKISTKSTLIDTDVPDNNVYIGNTLSYSIKKSEKKLPIWIE